MGADHPASAPQSSWQILISLAAVLAAVVGAVLGLVSGTLLERVKANRSDQRLFLEARMQLWLDTAAAFSAYLLSWTRLISIAKHEQALGSLNEVEQARKNKYVDERNEARQKLCCCLDQAFLFFSEDAVAKINAFRAFDDKQRVARLEELPTHEAWREHQISVLTMMKKEVGAK